MVLEEFQDVALATPSNTHITQTAGETNRSLGFVKDICYFIVFWLDVM